MIREHIAELQDRYDENVAEFQRADERIREVLADGVSDPVVVDLVFEFVVRASQIQDALRSTQGRLASLSARVDAVEGGGDA